MKNLLLTIVFLCAAAGGVGFLSYRLSGDAAVREAISQRNALEWLRTEFKLTDEQFARIKQLHESYSVECEQHCREIRNAQREWDAIRAAGGDENAARAAEARTVALRAACENAIAAHVRRCAAVMSPEAGERYLALVLPKISAYDHQAAPDVRLNQHAH